MSGQVAPATPGSQAWGRRYPTEWRIMIEKTEKEHDDRGLSARHLILVFLAAVAVCGVFFSLGFLVGYNERASRMMPLTERVANSPVTPPVVNPPPESPQTANTAAEPAKPVPQPTEEKPKLSGAEAASSSPAPSTAQAPHDRGAETPQTRAEPAPPPAPPAASGEVGVGFTVQVAASRAKEDAEALVKILKTRGYPVFVVSPEYAHANDNLFRVQVGPFAAREDAEKVRKQLAAEGFKPFIRH